MRKVIFILFLPVVVTAQIKFDEHFDHKTMRFDFFHTGNKDKEVIVFDKILEEPNWGGTKTHLIDDVEYGNYMFTLTEKESGKKIYSRGFSTLYQEWQTTEEAMKYDRVFQGSVIFPYPKNNCVIEIYKRDKKNIFQKIFEHYINPADYFISKERKLLYNNFKVSYAGNPSEKLDIVFIPDGYSSDEEEKFTKDCMRFADTLFSYSPFSEIRDEINIWGVSAFSNEGGVDIPAENVWKKSILNSTYYTFDSERYLMTSEYHAVRDLASNAPYDQIYILVNSDKYGGGAIYNYYSTVAVDCQGSGRVFIHEFGHGVAGLADEYFTDDVAYIGMYPLDVEPWEANITTLVDFDSKWKPLLAEDTPIPTPVQNEKIVTVDDRLQLGVYEGGGYIARGVYRPSYDSIMKTLATGKFNEASKNAIVRVLNMYIEK